MKTYKPFAKSVEDKPHTALGAAPIENIEDEPLAYPCKRIVMDSYFTGKTYRIKKADQPKTLHELIRYIQGIIAQDYDKAYCNYHAITDLCIEIIVLFPDGKAEVYIGS